MTDEQIEQEIQAKGLTASRLTPQDIEDSIAEEHYFTAFDGAVGAMPVNAPLGHISRDLKLVTICALVLKNGHRIVGVNTGPVSAENFDKELGQKLARQNAIDQLWPLLGFQLRDKLWQEREKQRTFAGPV